MDSVLVESPISAKSPNIGLLSIPNYDSMLKESVSRFLSSVHNETLDFSIFRSILSRLLQSSSNPPIEAIWFYSAIDYHESISSSINPNDRVLAIKNLVKFLSACSCSCGGLKSIALLAPIVSEIYGCMSEEETGEIEGLVEGLLSYISICSGKSFDNEDFGGGLLPCFVELVRVWTFGQSRSGSGLEVFFPLVSKEIRRRFEGEGCGVGYLSGVVIAEVFLLRLCLKIRSAEGSREDLKKELRVWAISSVTVFRNHIFFEILLRLLLDPTLPVFTLLDSKDENLLREILYDVVILVDYSFLNPGMNVGQCYDFTRCIAFRRLMVTHDAIRIASEKGDHGKAMSYMSAISTSCLPDQIFKWVANQSGIERMKRPDVNTPQVLLEWLSGLEDQGLVFFEDSMLRTKLTFFKLKTAPNISVSHTEPKEVQPMDDAAFLDAARSMNSAVNTPQVLLEWLSGLEDQGLVFFEDSMLRTKLTFFKLKTAPNISVSHTEPKEVQPMDDAAFLDAARSMNSAVSNGARKRKGFGGREATPMKFIKYGVHENSVKDYSLSSSLADGMSSGSEVDNPPSDDEMVEG